MITTPRQRRTFYDNMITTRSNTMQISQVRIYFRCVRCIGKMYQNNAIKYTLNSTQHVKHVINY